jgi:hypothetical protein
MARRVRPLASCPPHNAVVGIRAQRERIQMVGPRVEAIGVSLSSLNRAHMDYDSGGIKGLKPMPIGARQRMTLAGEQALFG